MRPVSGDSRAESHHESHHSEDDGADRLRAVEERLARVGSTWSPQLRRWRCPAHPDAGHSLRVRLEADGFVRLTCERGYGIRPGCQLGRVLDALGLSTFDLAPARFRA